MLGMTVEEAKTVELPINPITRVIKCAQLAGRFALKPMEGSTPLPAAMTRHGLIRLAEHREAAARTMAIVEEIQQRSLGEEA